MASQIDLNYQMAPESSCRVELVDPIQKLGAGAVSKGYQSYTNSQTGFTTFNFGQTLVDFQTGLRQPQMKSALFPSSFGEGCVTRYCPDSKQCPNSVQATTAPETRAMFDEMFAPEADFIGNQFPSSLDNSCVKGSSYGGLNGWKVNSSGKLNWQSNASQGSC